MMADECLPLLGQFSNAMVRRNVRELEIMLLEVHLRDMIDEYSLFELPSVNQLEELTLRIVSSILDGFKITFLALN